MNCHACQTLLQQQLDGQTERGAEGTSPFADHLAGCPECAALFAAARRLQDGLRVRAPFTPPADLTDRIVTVVLADPLRKRLPERWTPRPFRGWSIAAAVAAGLLVALGLWLGWPGRPGPGPKDDQVSDVRIEVLPQPVEEESPAELREAVAEAGSAVASLTSQTADATMGPTASLIPLVSSSPMEPLPMPPSLENTTGPLAEAGATLSADLEPVTDSVWRAVGLIRRKLPVLASEQPTAGRSPGKPG
jgi:hypothetical protein